MIRSDDEYTRLSLAELCDGCQQATARFLRSQEYDDGPCFEIFRRAICDGDDDCWERLHQIYGDQVTSWCRRACKNPAADHEELAGIAWARFWRSFTAERFNRASGVSAVLAYLRACAWSATADEARAHNPATSLDMELHSRDGSESIGSLGDYVPSTAPTPAEEVAATAAAAELWQLVDEQAKDERERLLLHLLLEVGLKAREIQALRPDLFPNVKDVYTLTRNVLDRVGRSPAIRRWREEPTS